MEKNPESCKNSACIGDVHVCCIARLPCAATKKCAMETVKNMTELMAEMIHGGQKDEPNRMEENND